MITVSKNESPGWVKEHSDIITSKYNIIVVFYHRQKQCDLEILTTMYIAPLKSDTLRL